MRPMDKAGKRGNRFSASKRDFLKTAALLGVYIGPVIKTFDMAAVSAIPTGPPKKKKDPSEGQAEPTGGQAGIPRRRPGGRPA